MSGLMHALLLTLAVASTLSAGLELELDRARALNRVVARLLFVNVGLIPLAVFGVLSALPLEHDVRQALQLVAIAPGGASSPLLARRAGGSPEFVALGYCTLSLASIALVATRQSLSGTELSWSLLAVVIGQLAPLAVGAWLRQRRPALAHRVATPVRSLGNVALFATIATLAVQRSEALVLLRPPALVAIVSVVALTLASALLSEPLHRRATAALSGVRNLTLVLAALESAAPGTHAALVVAAYGLVMYLFTAAIAASRTDAIT